MDGGNLGEVRDLRLMHLYSSPGVIWQSLGKVYGNSGACYLLRGQKKLVCALRVINVRMIIIRDWVPVRSMLI
jgi:hypothetical protein